MPSVDAVVPPVAGFPTFADTVAVLPKAPAEGDDWHVDPVVKQAVQAEAAARAARAEVAEAKAAKERAKRGDGKASVVGASFNLSNAVRGVARRCTPLHAAAYRRVLVVGCASDATILFMMLW